MTRYSPNFYSRREQRVARSAGALAPDVMGLLNPRSVIDIGCANGIWLKAFADAGAERICGVDGPWVPHDALRIPPESFLELDLAKAPTPYALDLPDRRFDLLISFELLEHLPASRGEAMVDLMCSLSDMLLVSAAVPHQGGTGHVNEQWPDYWSERFRDRGFVACDFFRQAYWNDDRIAPWYRQNIIGYFREAPPPAVLEFARAQFERQIARPAPLCHPGVFSYKLGKLRSWFKTPVAAAIGEIRRRR